MKVSLKWLREYVDITVPVEDLAARLTASGTEVAGIIRTGKWDRVQVGQVVKVEPHPNADRLRLATVTLGPIEKTVVCGAPNLAEGQKIAFAHIGAHLLNGHTGEEMELTPAKIRGVVSDGMVCSEKELGLSEEHEGILVLPEDAPVGAMLSDYLGDVVLDCDITPNRPDCYSMVGVAREVSILTNTSLKEPDSHYEEAGNPASELATIEVQDPDLCPRYTASIVTGVRIGPSPAWMQERLHAAGVRAINNVVDITNYVMLETGQPLHAFDYDRLKDHKVIVRRAREGERMTTLDGVERVFTKDNLLITDPDGPVGVGGVIGGANSEVSDSTTTILLESANFHGINIRMTETALRVRTEASARFDKGLHPRSAEVGLRRATKLLVELCGGTAASGIIDVYPTPVDIHPVQLTAKRLTTVLGKTFDEAEVSTLLTVLGCRVQGGWGEVPLSPGGREPERGGQAGEPHMLVTPPWWRPDIRIPDDLAEEVARITGYDALPTSSLRGAVPHMPPDPMRRLREESKDLLAAAGMEEIITYSLTSKAALEKVASPGDQPPMKVMNPMSAQQEYLRTSLRPGLFMPLGANERQTVGPLRMFEAGKVYLQQSPLPLGEAQGEGSLPEEREMLAAVIAGPSADPSWQGEPPAAGYFDAKGVVEALLTHLGVDAVYQPSEDPDLHPGRAAAIVCRGEQIGVVGEVHPEVLTRFDLVSHHVAFFELDVARLLPHTGAVRRYQPIFRFPTVVEDLAVLVDFKTPATAIEAAIKNAPLVSGVHLFDVYAGPQVPTGKKSLAYSISYQAVDRTLSTEEVTRARDSIVNRLRGQFGASLRS